jgi:hypothetical protein
MNESSPLSPSVQSTLSSLRSLLEITDNRIIQKKREMHESYNRAYNNLWREIETIQWILMQILTTKRRI